MAKEKISRKQLLKEPDEFISSTGRALEFVRRNTKWVAVGVIGIIVIGLAFWGFRGYQNRRESKAQDAYVQAHQIYRNAMGQTDEATMKDMLAKAVDRFQEVIQKHDGTQAAWLARIYRGHACLDLKRYEEAIHAYDAALETVPSQETQALIFQGLGHAWMAKDDLDKAIYYFQKLRDQGGEGLRRTALWNIAVCYQRQGKTAEALKLYRELENLFPDEMQRLMARAKAEALAPKTE
jgi:tetratricopeptide (TPR) repeat protein